MTSGTPAQVGVDGWISCFDRLPPEHSGKLLVTNNIEARDAFGHMSHLWLVGMIHGPSSQYGFSAFLESDERVIGITHWRPALAHRVEQLEAALKPLAGIPIEEFGWESSPDRPITGWNKHSLYVRDVLAARAALTGGAP